MWNVYRAGGLGGRSSEFRWWPSHLAMGPGETPGGAEIQEEDLARCPRGSPFRERLEDTGSKGVWLPGRKRLGPGIIPRRQEQL